VARRVVRLSMFMGAFALSVSPLLAADKVDGLPLVFEDDFERGADRWKPTDAAAWKVVEGRGGRIYSLFQQSKYQPPHRSPINFSLIRDLEVGNFVLSAKARSTGRDYGHRDMCLFFGYQDAAHFYYVHLGKQTDDHANQIFIVDGAPRKKISTKTTSGTPWDDDWHTVKVVRHADSGQIDVYFDNLEEAAMTASNTTFRTGQIGLGSFDDTGDWDDVKLWGEKVDGRQ
jgi:hypothetical protein